MNSAIVIIHLPDGKNLDAEIPLDISADQLITALHQSLNPEGRRPESLRCGNPYAYLAGTKKLAEYGFHNGTSIFIPGSKGT